MFEHDWMAIRNEVYRIKNVRWIVENENVAVCLYRFRGKETVERVASLDEVEGRAFSNG